MTPEITTPQAALKYEVEVREDGRVEFAVPFSAGTRMVVFVIAELPDTFGDLVSASQSSLDFWNNPFDDEASRLERCLNRAISC